MYHTFLQGDSLLLQGDSLYTVIFRELANNIDYSCIVKNQKRYNKWAIFNNLEVISQVILLNILRHSMCEVSIRSTDKCQGSNNLLNVMCTPHSYEFWVNVQFITVKNSTLTQNFRIFNRSTLASFNNTVHIHEGCGMLLWHSYIFLIYFFKSQSGNRAPMISTARQNPICHQEFMQSTYIMYTYMPYYYH